jgi:hypothetical protein
MRICDLSLTHSFLNSKVKSIGLPGKSKGFGQALSLCDFQIFALNAHLGDNIQTYRMTKERG